MVNGTSLRMTHTGESVRTESRRASSGPKEASTSPSTIPFSNFPEGRHQHTPSEAGRYIFSSLALHTHSHKSFEMWGVRLRQIEPNLHILIHSVEKHTINRLSLSLWGSTVIHVFVWNVSSNYTQSTLNKPTYRTAGQNDKYFEWLIHIFCMSMFLQCSKASVWIILSILMTEGISNALSWATGFNKPWGTVIRQTSIHNNEKTLYMRERERKQTRYGTRKKTLDISKDSFCRIFPLDLECELKKVREWQKAVNDSHKYLNSPCVLSHGTASEVGSTGALSGECHCGGF